MAATATKVCTVCSADCADRPRVKDEFGRYTCKACFDKQTRSAAAPVPKAAPKSAPKVVPPPMQHGFDDEGLDLRSAAMIEAKMQPIDLPEAQSCPKCHGYMSGEQRLCMRCGFDRRRGAKVATRVERLKEPQGERRSPVDVTWMVVGFGLVTVGCAVSAFAVPMMVLPATGLLVLLSYALAITMIVCQFRDGETVYGACTIAGLFLPLIGLVGLFWLIFVNERGWLKGLWACQVLSLVILIVALFSHAGDPNAFGAGGQ